MVKIGFLGLIIRGELKDKLIKRAKAERRTQTAVLEQALEEYFKTKIKD